MLCTTLNNQGFQLRAATLWILHPRRTLGILDGQLRLQKTRPLDGAWISNEDGSLRGEVQGERDKRRRTTARVGAEAGGAPGSNKWRFGKSGEKPLYTW